MNAKATPAPKFQIIPVKKLRKSPDNIRKAPASKREDAQLHASIKSKGVILPLIVKASGKDMYDVHGGGRRLEQVQALIRSKDFPATYSLACIVAPADANATEISIIENTLQAKMHPVDQYEAFHKLHHVDGLSIKEIGLHFGLGKKLVEQILALGGVHPTLRDLCRDGKLTVESLQAYACTDNQEKQLQAYETLRKKGAVYTTYDRDIRQLLTVDTFSSDHKYVKFITLKAYRARGGKATPDLFGGNTILHDAELVNTMLREKLEEVTTDLLSDGWKWAEVDLEYHARLRDEFGHQKPTIEFTAAQEKEKVKLQKQVAALDAKRSKLEESDDDIDDFDERWEAINDEIADINLSIRDIERAAETFSDRQKAAGGCIVTINRDGKLDIIRGLTRNDDKPKKPQRKVSGGTPPINEDDDNIPGAADLEDDSDGTTEVSPDANLYSQAVYEDLSCYHLAAARTELLYNHQLMYQAAQFAICWQMLGSRAHPRSFNWSLYESEKIESSKGDIESSRTHQELKEYRAKLDLTWIHDTEAESFRAFQELPTDAIVKLVAYCATTSLQKITLNPKYARHTLLDELLQQAGAKLAKHWRPSADNFFSRINNEHRLDIAHAMYAPNEPPAKLQKMKKGELSLFLQDRVNEFPPAKCWLPPGFTYIAPSEEDAMFEQLKKEAGQ